MRRREFIAGVGAAAVVGPRGAWGQHASRVRRIGVLINLAANDPEGQARLAAFTAALQQLGWTDGSNLQIDTRWASTNDIHRHAAELTALAPDVLLAANGTATVAPLLQATHTLPVVFVNVIDPVGAGFVASLAQPGGNATGFTIYEYSMSGKWLELLKEIAPAVSRAAVLRDPAIASGIGQFGAVQTAAPSLRVELSPVDVRDAREIDRAVTAFARGLNGGLIVTAAPSAAIHRDAIIALAVRHRLPAVYPYRFFVAAGGYSRTAQIRWTNTAAQPAILTVYSRGPNLAIFPSKHQLSSSWSSTSRPLRTSASPCRRRFSPAPTRSSNEAPRVYHDPRGCVAGGGGRHLGGPGELAYSWSFEQRDAGAVVLVKAFEGACRS